MSIVEFDRLMLWCGNTDSNWRRGQLPGHGGPGAHEGHHLGRGGNLTPLYQSFINPCLCMYINTTESAYMVEVLIQSLLYVCT